MSGFSLTYYCSCVRLIYNMRVAPSWRDRGISDIIELSTHRFSLIFSPQWSPSLPWWPADSLFAAATEPRRIRSSWSAEECMINRIPAHQRFRGKPINIDGLTDMTSYIKVCEIFPKNILQIKPERSKKYIYIFTIFLYPLPSQMVGGKLDRLCGLKRAGVWSVSNCKLR